MQDKKKLAAIAAVMQYLAENQAMMAAVGEASAETPESGLADRSVLSFPRPWGMSGRQAQMQMRAMVQMRAFK